VQGTTGAHAPRVPCTGRGICDGSGTCTCGGSFTGVFCQAMGCPYGGTRASQYNYTLETCTNGNPCVDMQTLAAAYQTDAYGTPLTAPAIDYSTAWDARQVRGCACSWAASYSGPYAYNLQRYAGYNCAEYACPYGPDPADNAVSLSAVYEVQELRCAATTGYLTFTFRGVTSGRVRADHSYVLDTAMTPFGGTDNVLPSTLESVLRRMNVTGPLVLTPLHPAGKLCDADPALGVTRITFAGLPGDVPLLRVNEASTLAPVGSTSVGEVTAGTIVGYECNRRGTCNRDVGQCSCQPQYGGGDGLLGAGQSGDCGHLDPLFGYYRHLATQPVVNTA
jgi:hypothetical protein